ncbi:MAG TPA: BBP7 family outer membrane beta-barrel protein [Gemmataceae bacterium]|nr:BBP7 family outer membrane beta-barrel protein [Gemmataceae bacterium]
MRKWWRGVAFMALGVAGTASAQAPLGPGSDGRPPITEPVPLAPSALGNLPSSMTSSLGIHPGTAPAQPQVPDSPNSLPGDISNAWAQDEDYEPGTWYSSLGFLGLQRQKLGNSVAALQDTASGGIDTGNPPPAGAPVAANFNDISPRFNYGTRVTVGYHWDTSAIEASGFYMSQSTASRTYANPGRLDTFFNVNGNPLNAPLGFEGDNGMWLQDDILRLQFNTAMGSGEVNYRWWLGKDSDFSWSIGVRFLDLYERLGFYAGDDDLTVFGSNGKPDPVLQATYTTTTQNRLVAPQLGLEWDKAINTWLAFTLTAKGAWGANFLDVNTLLQRGDGLVGFAGGRSQTIFSQMYEGGAFLDFYLMDNARLRAGYNLMWIVDVAEAVDQIDYNLANQNGRTNNHGSVFYHGPSVEFQVVF